MGKTLVLTKMGMDFYGEASTSGSDCENYRIETRTDRVRGKDGNNYFISFNHWERYQYRKTNKRTGEALKKEVKEILNPNGLHIDTEYEKVQAVSLDISFLNNS